MEQWTLNDCVGTQTIIQSPLLHSSITPLLRLPLALTLPNTITVGLTDVQALRQSAPLLRLISPEMGILNVLLTHSQNMSVPSECVGVWPAVLEMNLHTLQYGRFFSDLDEENANAVCVIGTGIRDDLFGSQEKVGREVVPIGETININGQPFTIVGMFQRYEGEQEKKERELAKITTRPQLTGPARRRGWGGRGNWAFWRKNQTVYLPLNTA